ncbi:MAG: type II secretion system protein GspM [Parvularculaceae bacterium]
MTAFWQNLSDREKLFVVFGGAIVAVLLSVLLILRPAINWRSNMHERRAAAEDLYRLVSKASENSAPGAAAAGVDLNTPLLNVLTSSAAASNVEVSYRNARADGGVDANLTAAPQDLFAWLKILDERYGVMVASADIAREQQGGVRAQLTLVRVGDRQ